MYNIRIKYINMTYYKWKREIYSDKIEGYPQELFKIFQNLLKPCQMKQLEFLLRLLELLSA